MWTWVVTTLGEDPVYPPRVWSSTADSQGQAEAIKHDLEQISGIRVFIYPPSDGWS
jgi:hypothetical protein